MYSTLVPIGKGVTTASFPVENQAQPLYYF
jgi:hypothetical protein